MRNAGQTIIVALAAGLLVLVASASGQVLPTQDGRELDASPALGSRYNYETPQGPQINSQLYVTGQVSGLAYFHGSPGYVASDQLQVGVPSSVQSDFYRRSVGVSDAIGGQTYMPSPYYSRSQTVLGLNSILSGQAAPGSNVPLATVPSATSLGQQLYGDAMADYRTGLASRGARTLVPEVSQTLPGAQPLPFASGAISNAGSLFGAPLRLEPAPAASYLPAGGLFGVAGGQQQAELARELYLQAHPELLDARNQPKPRQGAITGQLEAAVPGTSPLGQAQPNPAGAAAQPGEPGQLAKQDANQFGAQATLGGPFQKLPGTPVRNQDVFMDMLVTLRRDRDSRREKALIDAGLAPQRPAATPIQAAPVAGALVEDVDGKSMVLHGLAGESPDRFNVQMTQAGERLRANQYYDAAYAYETASYHDRQNPLARIGRGLSLLGAGESLSASYEIERAVQMFPMLYKARIDLPSIMNAQAVRKQLELMDERVKTASPEVRQRLEFLATFLYYNDQQFDKAKTYAQRLVKSIQNESLLRTYAEDVLKTLPPEQPQTPPTPVKTPETTGNPSGPGNPGAGKSIQP